MDLEIAHVNFSVKSEKETKEELAIINKQKRFYADDEGIAGCPWEDDKPVVGWHTDSYPFVCVLMLSDCTNMVGGETALRTGRGDVMKVRGPTMVSHVTNDLACFMYSNQDVRVVLRSCRDVTLRIRLSALLAHKSVLRL